MGIKRNGIGKAKSIPGGLLIAAIASILITIGFSLAITYYLNAERITWGQAGYWIMVMIFSASLIGGKVAYHFTKRKRFAISAMSGMLYWGILLCTTALFFGGDYGAVWETGAIIAAGSAIAAMISSPNSKDNRRNKGRAYC